MTRIYHHLFLSCDKKVPFLISIVNFSLALSSSHTLARTHKYTPFSTYLFGFIYFCGCLYQDARNSPDHPIVLDLACRGCRCLIVTEHDMERGDLARTSLLGESFAATLDVLVLPGCASAQSLEALWGVHAVLAYRLLGPSTDHDALLEATQGAPCGIRQEQLACHPGLGKGARQDHPEGAEKPPYIGCASGNAERDPDCTTLYPCTVLHACAAPETVLRASDAFLTPETGDLLWDLQRSTGGRVEVECAPPESLHDLVTADARAGFVWVRAGSGGGPFLPTPAETFHRALLLLADVSDTAAVLAYCPEHDKGGAGGRQIQAWASTVVALAVQHRRSGQCGTKKIIVRVSYTKEELLSTMTRVILTTL